MTPSPSPHDLDALFHGPFVAALGLGAVYAFWCALCAVGDLWQWIRRTL